MERTLSVLDLAVLIISAPDGVNVTIDQPVVVKRGPDWIPLDYGKNVEAGSALDAAGESVGG
jgi:hypothetical protein